MILESPVRAAVGAAGGGTIADSMTIGSETRVGRRPRGFVGLRGPQAADYLQRMVSNDVEALAVGESCDALLLTAKARVVAPLRVLRRAEDDFLAPDGAGAGGDRARQPRSLALRGQGGDRDRGAREPRRARRASRGSGRAGRRLRRAGLGGARRRAGSDGRHALGRRARDASDPRRDAAVRPGDRRPVLPAEAGLVERAVSLTKGCYPGQEPIARLHYRGHANRSLRVLSIASTEVPAGATPSYGSKGRRSAALRARCRRTGPSSRSRTCAPRFPTTPCSRSGAPRPGRYTRSPRARSSGDRAQPCGG